MNEFERKLRQQPFRQPPPELRAAIFAGITATIVLPPSGHWTWRHWLWPSPQAWGALAALWILYALLSQNEPHRAVPPAPAASADAAPVAPEPTLLSYHAGRDPSHVFDNAN
jgi:hypothetical protein